MLLPMLLATAAANPATPKFDALFGCMVTEVARQVGTVRIMREAKLAAAVAHNAALACNVFVEPATEEQSARKGSDPALAARIEAEEATLRTPEQTAEMHRLILRIFTEASFVDLLKDGSFGDLAQRYQQRRNADAIH